MDPYKPPEYSKLGIFVCFCNSRNKQQLFPYIVLTFFFFLPVETQDVFCELGD
jgi:hypothetical protein